MRGVLRAMRIFRRQIRPRRGALLAGALLAIIEVAVRLAEPWPLRIVVDHVLAPNPTPVFGLTDRNHVLALAVGTLLVVVGVAAALDYWSTRLLTSAGLRLAADVRGLVYTHLHRLSLTFHGRSQVGDLSARVTSDVDRTQDLIVQSLAVAGPNVVLVVGMFAVMFVVDPGFALVSLAATPMLAWAVHRATVRLKTSSREARQADGQVAAAATESLGVIQLVQAFGLERAQRERFDDLTRVSLEAGLQSARLQARFSPMVDLAAVFTAALVLWVGSQRVIAGELSLGMLLVFISYLGSLYKPLKALSRLATTWAKGGAAAERVQALLAEAPDIAEAAFPVPVRRLRGYLQFDEVDFAYGTQPVLSGINLEVAAGETVALVGPTGAGKSTLVSLVPRLLDPTRGAVYLDGFDVRGLQLEGLRSQVSMVLQDCVLLRGTLADNIRLGRPGASDADVRRAARLALVDEFADRLPDGLDTRVGERGATLSGGQRQRVAIARAILRDAPFLILDEPTSAVDPQSESLLVEALASLPGGRTTLVIAHRLSTVRRADRVAVLERGRLVQIGSPQGLAAREGRFRDLSRAADLTSGSAAVLPLRGSGGTR